MNMVWTGLLVLAAGFVFWWLATGKDRRLRAQQLAAAQEEQYRQDVERARKANEERQRAAQMAAQRALYEREAAVWREAEREANLDFTTALLLRPGEVVGYANEVRRIVTHKVGHQSDRKSSSSGTNEGSTDFSSTGRSTRLGFSDHGVSLGSSERARAGGTHRITTRATSGSGHTYSKDDIRTEVVDHGQLVLTNQRVVFQGDNSTIEVPLAKVVGFHFNDDDHLVIDYARRPTGECFVVPNTLAMKMAVSQRLHEPGFEVPSKPAILNSPPPDAPGP